MRLALLTVNNNHKDIFRKEFIDKGIFLPILCLKKIINQETKER